MLAARDSAVHYIGQEEGMGETIQLKASDGFTFDAYVAGPATATKGIVLIQEIFGVNHHIRDMADRFGAAGHAVVAPSVYDRVQKGFEVGYTAEDIAKGRDVRMKLDDKQLMLDVDAAAAQLKGKKVGIVGYCFGGTVAWWGATRSTSFAAAVTWYGGGIAGTRDEKPNCPVQMHFGETDGGCNERGSYSKPDYDQAQSRTLEFFGKHLG